MSGPLEEINDRLRSRVEEHLAGNPEQARGVRVDSEHSLFEFIPAPAEEVREFSTICAVHVTKTVGSGQAEPHEAMMGMVEYVLAAGAMLAQEADSARVTELVRQVLRDSKHGVIGQFPDEEAYAAAVVAEDEEIRRARATPADEAMCTCGHTAHWHAAVLHESDGGMTKVPQGAGTCDYNSECGCERFAEAT